MQAITTNIEQAHVILGHSSKETTRLTTALLNMRITRGTLNTCKSCAILKAKQKNLNQESEGVKANKFNGWVYHAIATVKEGDKDKKLNQKKCGTLRPNRQVTSSRVHSLFTQATCQRTCAHPCNKRRHLGIRSKSFNKTMLAKSKSW